MTETAPRHRRPMSAGRREFSKIKEVVAGWSGIRQSAARRGRWPDRAGGDPQGPPSLRLAVPARALGLPPRLRRLLRERGARRRSLAWPRSSACALALLWLWRGAIVEIEQGTTGVLSRYGQIRARCRPDATTSGGRGTRSSSSSIRRPRSRTPPRSLACPTQENVPLKAIEFFLKFRIDDPVAFVRSHRRRATSTWCSPARCRTRSGSAAARCAPSAPTTCAARDVGDMQEYLNRQLAGYGVRIIGANIPDVQLPDQYQQHLATRERVAKELAAYEREWELTRKQRIDTLLMEIERSKKERDARLIEVQEALNKARQDVAQMLEEQETEAQRVRLEIETRGRAALTEAENEATAPQAPRPGLPRQPRRVALRAGPPPARGGPSASPSAPRARSWSAARAASSRPSPPSSSPSFCHASRRTVPSPKRSTTASKPHSATGRATSWMGRGRRQPRSPANGPDRDVEEASFGRWRELERARRSPRSSARARLRNHLRPRRDALVGSRGRAPRRRAQLLGGNHTPRWEAAHHAGLGALG